MGKTKMTGIMVNGSVRSAGVTFYTRNGQTIVRTSRSNQPERRTQAQFDVRMRVRHNAALWQELKKADSTHFTGGKNAYARFRSLAFTLPVVYLKRDSDKATLLLPGIPVSEGTLPAIGLELGTVNGTPALKTDLRKTDLKRFESLLLYTAEQLDFNGNPRCRFSVSKLDVKDMDVVDGCLALVGSEFGNDMCGWAIVRAENASETRPAPQCSTQSIVTHCTVYKNYTGASALKAAAESYGGLTK